MTNTADRTHSDIVMMDARSLAEAISRRKVSCAEVMTAYLDHIEALNPVVNAIIALQDRDALLTQAQMRDAQVARGEIMGPLHGFPYAAKDLLWTKGIPSTSGSPVLRDFIPARDTLAVERVRAAGGIFVGKTNTPEFGLGSHTYNTVYGTTYNAYDQTKSAGGSSGGAAVALALRMLPLADGTDYGGSLRNPAGWNNVFGLRTSSGVVPDVEGDVWLPSMSVTGPMARSIADLAMLLAVQAGCDDRAPFSVMQDGHRFLMPLSTDIKRKRIAWVGDFGGFTPYEKGVLDVCHTALKVFESLGCIVEPATPDYPLEPVWAAFKTLRHWQTGSMLKAHYADPAKRAQLKPEAIFEVEQGAELSAYDIAEASAVKKAWCGAVQQLFQQYDFIIVPTSQLFPFGVNQPWPSEIAGRKMESYIDWMRANCLVTMTGCPSLAVPAGFGPHGLPMGLQIVAPIHHEMACLALGQAYETATEWTARKLPPLLQAADRF